MNRGLVIGIVIVLAVIVALPLVMSAIKRAQDQGEPRRGSGSTTTTGGET